MGKFALELLQAAATAAVPVCAAFLVQFLRRKSKQIGAQTDSLTAKRLLDEATDAVTTAVTVTSQTYVDALKRSGKFTAENQKIALDLAVERAKKLLTAEARSFLGAAYGNLNDYLVSRAEAEVRKQKLEHPAAGAVLESTEAVQESQDVASVAAAAAAATVAAVVQSTAQQAGHVGGTNRYVGGTDGPVGWPEFVTH